MELPTSRRSFLSTTALGAFFIGGAHASRLACGADGDTTKKAAVTARDYLQNILYKKEDVDLWLAEKAFPFSRYSSEFGWLLRSERFQDGVSDSISTYTYGPLDERITIHYKDQPCRINTYGNSYTQCHQVSDGETWQEFLAAHLQEPVRNFGVGGWSVYQAYLRMLREERRVPADYLIFNIYQDDHFRNLDAWRNIRSARHPWSIQPPLPHVAVNVKEGTFVERPNPCPTPQSLYHLCDLDWVTKKFENDFTLQIMLAHMNAKGGNPEQSYADVRKLTTTHGVTTRIDTVATLSEAADTLHRQAAYYSSQQIIEKIEAFAKTHGKKVLYVLSYPARSVLQLVQTNTRPDQPFFDFMQKRGLPVVDLLTAHANDFARFKGEVQDYVTQYFIGHYNPRGNFFCAQTLKDRLVELLDPKPLAYGPGSGRMKTPSG
jgi:hypothetical protein